MELIRASDSYLLQDLFSAQLGVHDATLLAN